MIYLFIWLFSNCLSSPRPYAPCGQGPAWLIYHCAPQCLALCLVHIVLSVGQAQGVLSGEWRMYWTLRKQGSPDQDGTLSLSWTLNHHILRAFQVTKPHLDGILSTTQWSEDYDPHFTGKEKRLTEWSHLTYYYNLACCTRRHFPKKIYK